MIAVLLLNKFSGLCKYNPFYGATWVAPLRGRCSIVARVIRAPPAALEPFAACTGYGNGRYAFNLLRFLRLILFKPLAKRRIRTILGYQK